MSSIQNLSDWLLPSSSGEPIADDAAHWSLERFIPIPTTDLLDHLRERGELKPEDEVPFAKICRAIAAVLHHRQRPLHVALEHHYAPLDPDRDTKLLIEPTVDTRKENAQKVTALMHQVLQSANYQPISREAIEASVGSFSAWGVPLVVNFDIFDELAVYARGDVMGIRGLRRWQRFWREEPVEVPLYQRMVVIFKIRPDSQVDGDLDPHALHLRMFKNIPQLDVEMLLPGTQIRITWFDRTKILVPTLGGIGMTVWKIARTALLVAALSLYTAAILVGLVLAALSYVVRTVFSYWQTKNRYMLNLARNLYNQKIDSNAGVIYRLLEDAEQQDFREAVLAYYVLLTKGQPISRRRWKRHVERILREAIDVEVDFEIDDALAKLQAFHLVEQAEDERWSGAAPAEALRRLDAWWDQQDLAGPQDWAAPGLGRA